MLISLDVGSPTFYSLCLVSSNSSSLLGLPPVIQTSLLIEPEVLPNKLFLVGTKPVYPGRYSLAYGLVADNVLE